MFKKEKIIALIAYLFVAVVAFVLFPTVSAWISSKKNTLENTPPQEPSKQSVVGYCEGKPCNVIVILADTLSAKNMSLYGYERKTTPYLDSLADTNAVVYDHMVPSAAWTPPSMAALFHSVPPAELKIDDVRTASGSMTKILKDSDVDVVGFLHIPPPQFENNIVTYFIKRNFEAPQVDFYGGASQGEKYSSGFKGALQWINDTEHKKHFFMFVHDLTVHDPYMPPVQYRGIFRDTGITPPDFYKFKAPTSTDPLSPEESKKVRLVYDEQVRHLDDELKDFIENVPDKRHTVIILLSDHGEAFGEVGGRHQHGRPFETNFAYAHDQVTAVPLLLVGGDLKKNRSECLVSTVDIAPTVLELMGVAKPSTFTGSSVLSDTCAHDIVYSDQTYFSEEFKTVQYNVTKLPESTFTKNIFVHGSSTIIAARGKKWKVIESAGGVFKLFNLEEDSREEHDLAGNVDALSESDKQEVNKIRDFIKNKMGE
jgi:arylsulfatase A-like enzyme